MTVNILSTVAGFSGTDTNWDITTPSTMDEATTTILGFASSPSDSSAPASIPSGWEQNVWNQGSGLGVTFGTMERNTPSKISNLLISNDQPSTPITFSSTNATSTGRNSAGVTFDGGHVRATCRLWNGSIGSNASGVLNAGNTWAMPNGGTVACVSGDKLIMMIATNRFDADFTVTAGSMTLTNITKHRVCLGNASGTPTISIWSADIGASQNIGSAPTITLTNPAGAAGSYMAFIYAVRPSVLNADLGASSNPIRVSVIGDSITQGGAFAGAVNGESTSDTVNERWIDRLFTNQADAVGSNLNFQTNTTITPGSTAAAITWYNGSYTPYDGSPTTPVKVRNMGQGGWSSYTHVLQWRTGNIANPTDSEKSPDILVICLGANDERGVNGATNTAVNFRDNLFALATVYTPAPYVVLVKEWAWAFDYAQGTAFARQSGQTHSLFLSAIDEAATLIRATGRTCIVVDTAVDASAAGGTNLATCTATSSFIGSVASSGNTEDNIHPNATYQDLTWRATIQRGLDQIPLLNPAPPPSSTWFPNTVILN